jgi:hypothetical protein
MRLAGEVACLADGVEHGSRLRLPDVPVLPESKRWVEIELPPTALVENASARVIVELAGIGRLVGECPIDLDLASFVR